MNFTFKNTAFSLTSLLVTTLGITSPAQAHLNLDFHDHGEQTLTAGISAPNVLTDISDYLNQPVPDPIISYMNTLQDLSSFSPIYETEETAWVAGGRISFIETAETTNGEYTLLDVVVVPGGGTPLHFHENEAEWFFMLDGELEFQLEDQTVFTPPETQVFGPQDGRHAFRNQTSDLARLLIYYEPTGVEDFFREVGQPVTNPFIQPPVNPEELLAAGPANGLQFPSALEFLTNEIEIDPISSIATVNVIRTGSINEVAGGIIALDTGAEIPIEFGIGESFQSIDIALSDELDAIDLTLQDPIDGTFIGKLADTATISRTSVPESSFPFSLIVLGIFGTGLIVNKNRKLQQLHLEPKLTPEKPINSGNVCI